jgi:hypothetical protein
VGVGKDGAGASPVLPGEFAGHSRFQPAADQPVTYKLLFIARRMMLLEKDSPVPGVQDLFVNISVPVEEILQIYYIPIMPSSFHGRHYTRMRVAGKRRRKEGTGWKYG